MIKHIAIDGMSGSGKTFLSDLLSHRLNAKIFHLDDYGNDFEPFIGLAKLFDNINQSKAKIIIYEGVGVFDNRFDIFKPYRILVKIPESIRKEQMHNRDMSNEKHSVDDWAVIGKIWDKAEKEYFGKNINMNSALVVSTADGDFDLDFIISRFNSQK